MFWLLENFIESLASGSVGDCGITFHTKVHPCNLFIEWRNAAEKWLKFAHRAPVPAQFTFYSLDILVSVAFNITFQI